MERSLIVVLVTCVSLVIPNFTQFLNIAGAVGAAMIAFILPPMLYLKEFKNELSQRTKIIQYLVMAFGVFGALYSLIYTALQIAGILA